MRKSTFIVAAVLLGSFAQAQGDTTRSLNEVVVTATKYPLKLSQTGKVLTVISREQIERSAGKDLAQLLTEQTGILVNGAYSNPGKDKSFFLRGASNEYTLILLDGVPVNDPTGGGGALDPRLLPVELIERIEILKGSQSTLYGSDAVAGVVNIITRKGGDKKLGAMAGASYGSYNSFKGNAGVNGSVDKVDYNVLYNYTATDGISEALDKTGTGNFDKDGYNRHAFQANINIKATDKLSIAPFYRYSYYKGDFDADAFTDGPNQFDYLLNNAGAIAKLNINNGSITANYGYTYAKRAYTKGAWGDYGFTGRFQSGEVYLNKRLNNQVQLLGGVNLQSYQLLDEGMKKDSTKTSIVSPYLSFLIQNETGLGIEIGGRYNHHSKFDGSLTYSINTSYTIDDAVKLFANVSTGFKAPTVSELFGFGANENLKPEKSENLEGGAQVFILQKKLSLVATAFKRDIKDLITYLDNRYTNVDEQKDKGFEVESTFNPNSQWNFKLSYTFVEGRIAQSRNGKDTSFSNLIRRPKHTINGVVGYQATKKLFVSLAAQHLGKRTDLDFGSFPSTQVNLDAFTLLNAYAEYKVLGDRLRLFVDAKNITDEDYIEVYGYSTQGFNMNGGFRFNF